MPLMSDAPRPITAADAAAVVPLPQVDANKYSRGNLVVVAGSARYPGAAVLAAQASARCGCGYTTLCVPQPAVGDVRAHLLSVPVVGCADVDGTFGAQSVDDVVSAAPKARAYTIGCGVGRTQAAQDFVWAFLSNSAIVGKPLVIDADALFAIAQDPRRFASLRPEGAPAVLTPHEGEAARLLGHPVSDRLAAVRELADTYQATVVLKGPQTVITAPSDTPRLCVNAGPELAKAGTGDVLAGMIGAFLAQGMSSMDAACLGVYLHGRAGASAAARLGVVSVMPEDVIDYIAPAICSLEPHDAALAAARLDAETRATAL